MLSGINQIENELGLTPSHEPVDEHTQQAMESLFQEALHHPDNYLWLTNWQIILKSENKAIGSADFKNIPDENGQVEIGYGTNTSYQGQGYMTETVQALCEWAFMQKEVNCVIAETEKENYASQRVLQKCGMAKYKETENGYWWKLEKTKN